jgi:hypothetical protein
MPEWVHSSRPRKKRRTSIDSSSEESSSGDEMDVDEDDLSAQPLAKLLQDADSLTRRTETNGSNKRKLRPEVIDIQRMKDITASGPVKDPLPIFQYSANQSSCTVRSNVSPNTLNAPSPHLLGPQLQHMSPPFEIRTTESKSPPDNASRKENTNVDSSIPPLRRRSANLPWRSPTILPRLEPREWHCRESNTSIRTPRHATQHGALQTFS